MPTLHVTRVGEVEAFKADGATNHILLRLGTFGSQNLLITWTTVAPRGHMRTHSHPGSEQVYVVLSGMARMQVGEEREILSTGALVYVPPGATHGIGNAGRDELVYLTAASPPFPVERYFAETEPSQGEATEPIEVLE
mgnify:CR=1 FL=1